MRPPTRAMLRLKLAADQGDAAAQYNLGVLHYHGHGVAKDFKRAAELAKLAADQGDAKAQSLLEELREYFTQSERSSESDDEGDDHAPNEVHAASEDPPSR